MTSSGKNEREAAQGERQQNQAAFEEFFHQHWERIYRLVVRLTGDPSEAEDLALEAFWRLWQRPPAHGDNLAGWLYRVASNLAYNALRANQRRQRYEERAGRAALELTAAPARSSQDDVAALQEQVRQTLRKMPLRQAQLLILRSNGLSYQEIAAALLIRPTSVGALLARAEQTFERLYERSSTAHAPKR